MFCYCFKFNKNISKWNVSNVTTMYRMFYEATNFDGADLKEPLLNAKPVTLESFLEKT